MIHFPLFSRPSLRSSALPAEPLSLLPLIALPFLLGLALGSVIGLYSDAPQELLSFAGLLPSEELGGSFLHSLWHSARFIIAAVLLGTGILGVFALPLLTALRAFSFACSIAAVMHPLTFSSFLFAMFSFGLPALLELPGFLIAATAGFRFSGELLRREPLRPEFAHRYVRYFLTILILCIADAVYMQFLLPLLLSRLL